MVTVGKKHSFCVCYNIFSSENGGQFKDIQVKYKVPFQIVASMKDDLAVIILYAAHQMVNTTMQLLCFNALKWISILHPKNNCHLCLFHAIKGHVGAEICSNHMAKTMYNISPISLYYLWQAENAFWKMLHSPKLDAQDSRNYIG